MQCGQRTARGSFPFFAECDTLNEWMNNFFILIFFLLENKIVTEENTVQTADFMLGGVRWTKMTWTTSYSMLGWGNY